MAASIATRTQPDLFKGPVWDSRWAKNGFLEAIDPYLTQEELEDFYEKILDEGLIDGKRYIWPWNFGTNGMGTSMLLYTPNFEKAGVDWQKIVDEGWTMEEFVDIAKKLTWDTDGDGENDHFAISFGAKDTHNILNFLYAFGGKLTNEDETQVTFNSPEAAAGDVHYPGTYLAGVYNRLKTEIAGEIIENEDLVNVPNWLPLSFRIEDGDWFRPGATPRTSGSGA